MARTETVTVVFTDLVGSTELASRLGHDAYEALRHAHFTALRGAVTKHNGSEVKTPRRRPDAALRQRGERHCLRRRHAAGDPWSGARRRPRSAADPHRHLLGRSDARG